MVWEGERGGEIAGGTWIGAGIIDNGEFGNMLKLGTLLSNATVLKQIPELQDYR